MDEKNSVYVTNTKIIMNLICSSTRIYQTMIWKHSSRTDNLPFSTKLYVITVTKKKDIIALSLMQCWEKDPSEECEPQYVKFIIEFMHNTPHNYICYVTKGITTYPTAFYIPIIRAKINYHILFLSYTDKKYINNKVTPYTEIVAISYKANSTKTVAFEKYHELENITLSKDNYRLCIFCSSTTKQAKLCSQCKLVYYCNRDCQKNDWKSHKPRCNFIKNTSYPSHYSQLYCSGCNLYNMKVELCKCGKVYYCDNACKKDHEKKHRNICKV